MNKKIKSTVYEILDLDEYSREDDWYLIIKTLQQILDFDAATAFIKVLQGMKYHGISFESITRYRRKWEELHPEIEIKARNKRQDEEKIYHMEFSR